MKKLLFLILFFNSVIILKAQDCPEFSFTIDSQEEMEEFFELYPNCTNITNSLRLGKSSGSSTLTDLSQLSQIISVGGDLLISNNPLLSNLNGLQNIKHVGVDVEIYNNDILSDITALNLIETIGEDFDIRNNESLSVLGQFNALDSIHENLELTEIPITNLDAFQNLVFVDDLSIQETDIAVLEGLNSLQHVSGNLYINDNLLLESINDFAESLEVIDNLKIYENPILISINGFNSLNFVTNALSFKTNASLLSFIGSFEALDSIGGDLIFEENPQLNSLPNFNSLVKSSSIFITNNDVLLDLSGLETLNDLLGKISIQNNENLTSLFGLENINPQEVTSINLSNNPNLAICDIPSICELIKRSISIVILGNASGCSSYTDVYYNKCRNHECHTGGFNISSQEQIDSFDVRNPYCTFINGDLIIGDQSGIINSNVIDISGLAKIDTVWGSIIISNNQELEILEGFEDLEYLNSDLTIEENPILNEIDVVDKLKSIGGNFLIKNNPLLVKKWQPYSVNVINGDLEISNNPLLSNIGDFLNLSSIGGSFIFDNNDANSSTLKMEKLISVGGDFIYRNNALSNTPIDTRKLKVVGGDMIITNNESFRTFSYWGQDTIGGDFICTENPNLTGFRPFELRAVYGDLVLSDNEKLISISNTENTFSHLGGDLVINNNILLGYNNGGLTGIVGLIELTSLSGKLEITNNPELKTLSGLERISHQGIESISIIDNEKLEFCNIQSVCGALMENVIDVNISGNKSLCTNRDTVIQKCDLSHCWTGTITLRNQEDVDLFVSSNPTCTVINGDLNIERNDPKDLSGLQNITTVTGTLTISVGSEGLETLTGLHNIREVGSLNIYTTIIENLTGLEGLQHIKGEFKIRESSLQSLDGLSSLERIGRIYLFVPYHLPSFKGLESLRRIDNGFQLHSVDGLISLDGLENVEEFSGGISISNCNQLVNINGINNFPVDSISGISISSNDNLQNCTSKLFCNFLNLNPNSTIIGFSNGEGCKSDADLNCKKYSLSGLVFYDSNGNGLQEENENGIKGIEVNIATILGKSITNEEGQYFQFADSGSVYSISLEPNADWELTSALDVYEVTFNPLIPEQYNFGVKPTFDRHSTTMSLTAENNRCNEQGKFYLKIQNTGTYKESGEIKLTLDPLLEFIYSDLEPTIFDELDNTLIWNYDELYPHQIIEIAMEINMPDQNHTGTILNNFVEQTAFINNELTLLSTILSEVEVRCSYDPNDKQSSPIGVGEHAYILKDQPLTYTIRFQNTGNDYAENVTLVDTISPNFDMNSFEVLNSSHKVFTQVEGNVVTFFFEEIYLVDSLTNESASHGFISFKLHLLENVEDFTLVENYANIFFDFNPPIRTNTVTNTAVEEIPTSILESEKGFTIDIRPNPSLNKIYIISPVDGTFDIYDNQMNKIVHSLPIHSNENLSLNISQWSSGIYFIRITSTNGIIDSEIIMKL